MKSVRRFRVKLRQKEHAFYHCVSRIVDKRFIFGEAEKTEFVSLMERYAAFTCVQLLSWCVMGNHFHLLVKVSARPEQRWSESELLAHTRVTLGDKIAGQYEAKLAFWRDQQARLRLQRLRHAAEVRGDAAAGQELDRLLRGSIQAVSKDDGGADAPQPVKVPGMQPTSADLLCEEEAQKILDGLWRRLFDVSSFLLSLKQQFTVWFNRKHKREGTLWEERFKSTIVQGGVAVAEMAAYIDLNPVRAGLVSDPKDYWWSGYGRAVRGDAVAQARVLEAASYYMENPPEVVADEISKLVPTQPDGPWNVGQRHYRMLMYRRGLARRLEDGSLAGFFSQATVAGVLSAKGILPSQGTRKRMNRSQKDTLPSDVSYVKDPIRAFTGGLALGWGEFVEEVFQLHRHRFGQRRLQGARPIVSPGKWGGLRALRELGSKKGRVKADGAIGHPLVGNSEAGEDNRE